MLYLHCKRWQQACLAANSDQLHGNAWHTALQLIYTVYKLLASFQCIFLVYLSTSIAFCQTPLHQCINLRCTSQSCVKMQFYPLQILSICDCFFFWLQFAVFIEQLCGCAIAKLFCIFPFTTIGCFHWAPVWMCHCKIAFYIFLYFFYIFYIVQLHRRQDCILQPRILN